MPVQRFKSVEAMPSPELSDHDLVRRIRAVWSRARVLTPLHHPPGVFRFRTLEAASQARADLLRDRARRLQTDTPP